MEQHELWTQNWNCNRKDDYEDYEIEREEIETILKKLKSGKASGEDNIPSELYKYVSGKFKTRLLTFLNEIHVSWTALAEWNTTSGIGLLVYKRGDRIDPNNDRGINLLNSCYKTYTKILHEKLRRYSETSLDETQSGFIKWWLCIDSAFTLKVLL
jgi:hypothetical protein